MTAYFIETYLFLKVFLDLPSWKKTLPARSPAHSIVAGYSIVTLVSFSLEYILEDIRALWVLESQDSGFKF